MELTKCSFESDNWQGFGVVATAVKVTTIALDVSNRVITDRHHVAALPVLFFLELRHVCPQNFSPTHSDSYSRLNEQEPMGR